MPKALIAVLFSFDTCGVDNIGSSLSSGSMGSSSSSPLLEEAEPSIFTLPTEPDTPILSGCPHNALAPIFGGSMLIDPYAFLCGIAMPFCVMVGEESGELWSASVE